MSLGLTTCRLDIAYNDFIIRRQIEKLQSLFSDPVAQELEDAHMNGVTPMKIPSLKGNVAATHNSRKTKGGALA